MSANTGTAPAWTITLADEAKVKDGTITSSPTFISNAFKARNKAEVQLFTATAYFAFTYFSNSCSKLSVSCPIVSQPLFSTFVTAAISSMPIEALVNGMVFIMITFVNLAQPFLADDILSESHSHLPLFLTN